MFAWTSIGRTVQWKILMDVPLPLTGFTMHKYLRGRGAATIPPSKYQSSDAMHSEGNSVRTFPFDRFASAEPLDCVCPADALIHTGFMVFECK